MSKLDKLITISAFVRQLEEFNVDFYKNCLLKTNQFSTKFILQQVIQDHLKYKKDIIPDIDGLGEEQVESRYLENIIEDFRRNYVENKFELESLNFVEATELAVILIEYVIKKYEILLKYPLSSASKKSLDVIFQKKQNQLEMLKKEYEKRRYK
jgi:hypothetical protein